MNNRGRRVALVGAFLQLGPLIGLVGTFVGIIRAFYTLESSSSGDPARLSANVTGALYATAAGLVLSVVGLILIYVALFRYRYRAEWFFGFLLIYGGVLLAGFPIGTVFGIVILSYCLMRRNEFLLRVEQIGDARLRP